MNINDTIKKMNTANILLAAFGCTYARRHFIKWHLVGDSTGLHGQKIMN